MTWTWLDQVLPDAVVVMDEQQLITVFNPAAERLWGHRAEEVIGRPLTALLPARFAAGHAAQVQDFAGRGEPARRMDRRAAAFALRRDGAEIPCEVSIARRVQDGRAEYVAIVRDLSEQQRVRNIARIGGWEWEVATDRLECSSEAAQLLGLGQAPGGARWADFLERVHPADRERVEHALRRTFEEGAAWDLEHRVVRLDGSVRDVRQVGDTSRDRTGRVLRMVATVHDVTDMRTADRGLAQSEATLRALFATSREAIVLLDSRNKVRAFNEAAATLAREAQLPLEEGQPLCDRARAGLGTMLEQALAGEYVQLERKMATPSRWLELSGSPVHLPGGAVAGVTLVCRDVTERRAAEAQLRQAQKMDTVGQLAGGIAHDFNNLLTVIIAAASALRHDLGSSHPSGAGLADIEGASERAAALTRRLLSFARLQPNEPRVVDVAVVLAGLEPMLRRVLGGGGVRLHVHLQPGCFVRIDPTQLDQVLMNLAVNARDAMPRGGTLSLVTERRAELGQVRVRVTDTGPGIDPAIRGRLFEPFFTTKPLGQGTGLGLATCYGIVKQAGGRIELASPPGQGACFEVSLPLAASPVEQTAER